MAKVQCIAGSMPESRWVAEYASGKVAADANQFARVTTLIGALLRGTSPYMSDAALSAVGPNRGHETVALLVVNSLPQPIKLSEPAYLRSVDLLANPELPWRPPVPDMIPGAGKYCYGVGMYYFRSPKLDTKNFQSVHWGAALRFDSDSECLPSGLRIGWSLYTPISKTACRLSTTGEGPLQRWAEAVMSIEAMRQATSRTVAMVAPASAKPLVEKAAFAEFEPRCVVYAAMNQQGPDRLMTVFVSRRYLEPDLQRLGGLTGDVALNMELKLLAPEVAYAPDPS